MASVQIPGPIFSSPYYYDNALTPESMMVYLTTRLGSVDAQIQGIFSSQQEAEKVRAAVNQIKELLTGLENTKDDPEAAKKAMADITAIIDEQIANVDPVLADKIKSKLTEQGQILYKQDKRFSQTELEGSREYLKNLLSELESTAEMNMIQLQSLMSARQTAISLATNLIAKLHESTAKVVDNIR